MADSHTLKKRKFSKGKKKNWRKFTDVRDVETYLEDKSREERTGGPAADKADEELFVISTEGPHQEGEVPELSRRHWHQLNLSKNVPSSLGNARQRRGKRRKRMLVSETPENGNMCASDSDSSESKEPSLAQFKRSRLGRKALRRATRVQAGEVGHGVKRKRIGGVWDVWDAGDDPSNGAEEEQIFLQMTGKNKPKLPKTLANRQPSLLPTVEVAAGGASYNPSFGDHQDLLRVAVAEAEVKEKEEGRVERWYKGVPQLGHLQRERIWSKEISEGLFEDVPSADEGSGQDSDVAAYREPIRADNRRTAKQRRKEKERQEQHVQQVTQKQRRIREGEVYRLKTLKKEIRRDEALRAKKMEMRQKKSALGRKTFRLGRIRYEEPVTVVKLSSELTGSLRALQPEGSIAQDRYKSLLKRNVMEPRKRFIQRRKYKLRFVDKRSCRIPEDDM